MAHQRRFAGAVGGLHVADHAVHIRRHIGQRVVGVRFSAVAAAGEIKPHSGNAMGGQVLSQGREVAVSLPVAGKAMAQHHQRQSLAPGRFGRQLDGSRDIAPRTGDLDVLGVGVGL